MDGQLRWQDLLRPVAECSEGIRVGGLVRWFDNNTFYRQPIIHEKVRWRHGVISGYIYYELLREAAAPKVVLPSPFTFATLCDNRYYESDEALIEALSTVLNEAAKELTAAGIKHIQFSEPVAVARKITNNEKKLIQHALSVSTQELECDTSIHTFFGDLSHVYPEILDWPISSVGADFYSTSVGHLKEFRFTKPLIAGCVDGRNSLLEGASGIANFARGLAEKLEPPGIVLAPNCDLEFLPRAVAEEKMSRLAKARHLLEADA